MGGGRGFPVQEGNTLQLDVDIIQTLKQEETGLFVLIPYNRLPGYSMHYIVTVVVYEKFAIFYQQEIILQTCVKCQSHIECRTAFANQTSTTTTV